MALQWIHHRNPIAHGDRQLVHSQSPGLGLLGNVRSDKCHFTTGSLMNHLLLHGSTCSRTATIGSSLRTHMASVTKLRYTGTYKATGPPSPIG